MGFPGAAGKLIYYLHMQPNPAGLGTQAGCFSDLLRNAKYPLILIGNPAGKTAISKMALVASYLTDPSLVDSWCVS